MNRTEDVPSVLAEWIDRWSGGSLAAEADELADAGCRALDSALSLPAADRRTAHALLAADASLTAAVERLSDAVDPSDGLRRIIERVVSVRLETGEDA